jgi:hypothetical protein
VTEYLKIDRASLDVPIWPALGELHSRGEAWVDVVALSGEEHRFCASIYELAERWRWNPKTVSAFLRELRTLKRIECEEAAAGRRPATYVLVNSKKKPRSQPQYHEYEQEFEQLWRAWKGRAPNSRKAGLKRYAERRRAGVSFEILKKAVISYYYYCREHGILGTEKMMMTQTFFGPNERWKGPFKIPRGGTDQLRLLSKDDV